MMDLRARALRSATLTNLDFARKFKTDEMYDGLGQVRPCRCKVVSYHK
jgi:hypothetical protein